MKYVIKLTLWYGVVNTYFAATDLSTLFCRKSFLGAEVTMNHIFNINEIIIVISFTNNKLQAIQ